MSCRRTHDQKTQKSPSDSRLGARYWSDGSSHFFPYHSLQQEAERKHHLCSWSPNQSSWHLQGETSIIFLMIALGLLIAILAILLKYGLIIIMGFPKGCAFPRVGSFFITSLTLGSGRQQAAWRSWHTGCLFPWEGSLLWQWSICLQPTHLLPKLSHLAEELLYLGTPPTAVLSAAISSKYLPTV